MQVNNKRPSDEEINHLKRFKTASEDDDQQQQHSITQAEMNAAAAALRFGMNKEQGNNNDIKNEGDKQRDEGMAIDNALLQQSSHLYGDDNKLNNNNNNNDIHLHHQGGNGSINGGSSSNSVSSPNHLNFLNSSQIPMNLRHLQSSSDVQNLQYRDCHPDSKPAIGTEEWHRLRKDNHKEVERRRRENINQGINALAEMVPNCDKNKSQIIRRAVDYIKQLKEVESNNMEKWTLEKLLTDQTINELTTSNEKLKIELEKSYREIENWKKYASNSGKDEK